MNTSLWFDDWHPICPLSNFISSRKIYYAGLSLKTNVADVVDNGRWIWPKSLSDEFDGLTAIDPPTLINGKNDKILWKINSGRHKDFSCIPRHSFVVWLAIHGRLKTHDKMRAWELKDNLKCIFCKKVKDSHAHLFFSCEFTSKIWSRMKGLVKLNDAPFKWSDILNFLLRRPCNKPIWSVLQRLLIGATIYFVWQERNIRIFQDKNKSIDVICNLIKDTVRLRVTGLSLNESAQVFEAA
ncbi:RNA-directed DNA polymerase, eukaryota, reverse transcriptase zinc-binding domain protein [Tanacetum coccineum]